MKCGIRELTALKDAIDRANNIVAFTGAGISVPSGIPDFRSENGIYSTKSGLYSPEQVVSHDFFFEHTKEFYEFYIHRMVYPNAEPNVMHKLLADLERTGKLSCIVTQNIDGLHQKAGNKRVLELHGSINRNHCVECLKSFDLKYISGGKYNCDECGGTVKPDVVLYGESLDQRVLSMSVRAIERADMFMIIGTSLAVYPAAGLVKYFKGDRAVLINKSKTPFDSFADIIIREDCSEVARWIIQNYDFEIGRNL